MTLEEATQRIEAKGFPFFKVELEAVIDYNDPPSEVKIICPDCQGTGTYKEVCSYCDGTGFTICPMCKGTGQVNKVSGSKTPCPYCKSGHIAQCSACKGKGARSNGCVMCNGEKTIIFSPGFVDNWKYLMLQDAFLRHLDDDLIKKIVHIKVYHDVSVSAECTVTFPISEAVHIKEIIESYTAACNEMGRLSDTNAGLHISVLPTPKYPPRMSLPHVKVENFRKSVNKLLLAMVLLGSDGERTRSFRFRDLTTSATEKRSAIYTVHDTIIEYRLFDPCFHKPWRAETYIKTIAATLKYYDENPPAINLPTLQLLGNCQMLKKNFDNGTFSALSSVFDNEESVERARREMQILMEKRKRDTKSMVKAVRLKLLAGGEDETSDAGPLVV